MKDYGLISTADYHQVFEEVCMSVIEGLVKHAITAEIKDFRELINNWITFYTDKELTRRNNK